MARRWRASEDAQLARLYASSLPLRVIAERLGRSEEAITARRKLLGIAPRRRAPQWTEQQDRLIVLATRAGVSAAAIARQQGRSTEQVRARRAQLVGKRPPARHYQPSEDDAITAAWAEGHDLDELALRLGRSPDALRLRARTLGLHAPAERRRWSAAEDHALRDGYSAGHSCEEIHRFELPRRSPGAIAARAHKLGLTSFARTWTPQEERRLAMLLARGTPIEQIALALTRSPEAIRQRARRRGLQVSDAHAQERRGRRWKDAEDEILLQHPGVSPGVLSDLLARSDHSIRQRQSCLGVRTGNRSPHHARTGGADFSPAEDRLLRRELLGGEPPKLTRLLAISSRLERTPGDLQRRRRELSGIAAFFDDVDDSPRSRLGRAS
jgi:hypothetical protein